MLKTLEQWLFPNICCLCQDYTDSGRDLCRACHKTLPRVEDRCFRCGLILEEGHSVCCQNCTTAPPLFDRLCAVFDYQPPVVQWVSALKFAKRLAYGRVMGELLLDAVPAWYKNEPLPEALIPVPLHQSRHRDRGFNQALELLWPVHKVLEIPIVWDACLRSRKTQAQSQLSKDRRQRNLKSAFQMRKTLALEHVAIMDDVVTTGSTVKALSQVLKEAGVERVDIWCICRA